MKIYLIAFLLIIGILLLSSLSLTLGSVTIPIQKIGAILFSDQEVKESWRLIIFNFRIPKLITACFVGAGLSVSGLLMQTLFRNPLAEPYILGISSGASLGVSIVVLVGGVALQSLMAVLGSWVVIFASIVGSITVMLIITLLASRFKDVAGLLIVGVMIGSATSAIMIMLQYFSNAQQVQDYLIWTLGSLGNVTWEKLPYLIGFVILSISFSFGILNSLNAYLLGEEYAMSLGVNIRKVRFIVILSSSISAAVITAFCGPIGFIGIAVPHFTRILLKTSNHKKVIPISILVGANVMLFCDIIATAPWSETVFPINAITALLGAPIVISVLLKRKGL